MQANPTGAPTQVRIHLADRSYPIVIGSGLLGAVDTYLNLPPANTALVVSNTTVAPLYADQLQAALRARYARVILITLPDGEVHKDWPTLQLIFDALQQKPTSPQPAADNLLWQE